MVRFDPQSSKCLMCGSHRLRRFKASAFDSQQSALVNIVECQDCIFGWQYPLGRTEEQSVEYFEAAYADNLEARSDYFDEAEKRDIAKLELGFVDRLPVKNKNLLDVGAGSGIFAEIAVSAGWQVTAIDPALELKRLQGCSGLTPIKGTTDLIPDGTLFDVITMWDVVEHAANPTELILDSAKYLKEGGWLVLETGNYKSADRVSEDTNHWIYQLDHRWYFSPDSLEQTLSGLGFSEFIVTESVLRPNWFGKANYPGPSRAEFLESIIKDPIHFRTYLSRYFSLTAAKKWRMSGLSVFAIAAKKSGE